MFNPLSGDLYGDDARRWQEEEKERLQVAEAIEQVAVAMKKAAEEEAAAGEEEEDMDEVGYGGPKVGLTLFQCMWVNAEIRDCIVSFVLDGRDNYVKRPCGGISTSSEEGEEGNWSSCVGDSFRHKCGVEAGRRRACSKKDC